MLQKIKIRRAGLILSVAMAVFLITIVSVTMFVQASSYIASMSIKGIPVPKVGEHISTINGSSLMELPTEASKYKISDNALFTWNDEEDRPILGGQQVFEAGRTYSISVIVYPSKGFSFRNTVSAELYNLYPYQYKSSVKVESNGHARVTFTFEVGGERVYNDINLFHFYGLRTPRDGDELNRPSFDSVAYNNSELSDCYWTSGNGTRLEFGTKAAGGQNYFLNFEFNAFSGYKYADKLSIFHNHTEKQWQYSFNSAKTKVKISIPYSVDSSTTINHVLIEGMFTPTQLDNTEMWVSHEHLKTPNHSHYSIPPQTKNWFEAEAKYSTDTHLLVNEGTFLAGKQYKMFLIVHADDGYKFAPTEIVSFEFSGVSSDVYSYTVEYGGSESSIIFVITFTAQFPDGAGTSKNNPAICTEFCSFKYAMENDQIPYVALSSCYEYLPPAEGDSLVPGAVSVRGVKNLYLTGNTTFVAPTIFDEGYCDYDALLYVTYPHADFRIFGPGSLTYQASSSTAKNAVISNVGGNVYVYDGTLRGEYNASVLSRAIWQEYGELTIFGGSFVSTKAGDNVNICDSVRLMGGKARIWDGEFYTNVLSGSDVNCFGLNIGREAEVDILGGVFYGIFLPSGPTPLADYMDEDVYTPFSNGNWFNPLSEYSQEYVAGGKEVQILRWIKELDVNINAPTPGVTISSKVYNVPLGCDEHEVYWYEDGKLVGDNVAFVAGKSYKVEIYFLTNSNGRFAVPLTSATVNYQNAEVKSYAGDATKDVYLTYDFGKCPYLVKNVDLTIDVPKQNAKPDQYAVCGDSSYKQALAGDNNFDAPLQWQESTDGKSWTKMKLTDTFTVGRYYKVYIDVMPANGYKFMVDSRIETLVSAKVNGHSATVSRYPESDPEEIVSICYEFGILNDTVIEQIDIDGVIEPVVGEKPNYNCAVTGVGYHLNSNYDDAYSGNVIQNGMGWWDYTTDNWVAPNDVFEIGHEYKLVIYVAPDTGYEFYTTDKYYEPKGWGYINGNYATFSKQSNARYEQTMSWIFDCEPKTFKSVSVMGLDVPADGFAPDYEVYTDSDYYTVESIEWWDQTKGMDMTGADTFAEGNEYWVTITVVPNEKNGESLCEFVNNKTTAYLNGIEVKKISGVAWQEVVATRKTILIRYNFTNASNEKNYFISGKIVGSDGSAGDLTLQLFEKGSLTASYETTVNGNSEHYFFAGILSGSYTLKVSRGGQTLCTYAITVADESVIQDIILSLLGDADGNGIVESDDAIHLLYHVLFGDQYVLTQKCDFDGSGTVDSDDAIHLLYHVLFGAENYPLK